MKLTFDFYIRLFVFLLLILFFYIGSSDKEDKIIKFACFNTFELVKEVDDCINTAGIENLFVKKEFKNE